MRRPLRAVALLGLIGVMGGIGARADDAPQARARPLILVHDMPWYESKPVSGHWGWHWTMGHFDPERSDSSGKREIASQLYPTIGPYDSADPDVLEYHTLLMKVAGIDGVIADWYGSEDFNDYASIHRRTALLFEALARRGLKFAVCYEDRILKAMSERDKLTPAQAVEHAQTHLRFCEEHWFNQPTYVTWQGKPLLLVFGPDFLNATQWEAAFAGLKRPPAFFTLHERKPPAVGSFAWPPMWASKNGVLETPALDAYLDRVYGRDEPKLAAAFPGFKDIYAQAGVQPTHGFLDDRDGATFRDTLNRALASGSPIVQIATWNDFGEGTCIEPTRERGDRDLLTIQQTRRQLSGASFPYQPADLRLPFRLFTLRKRFGPTSPQRKGLDETADLISAGECGRASRRLDELERGG
jgi:Glycosyl hydrolase family 99